jgi:hypothetical protein
VPSRYEQRVIQANEWIDAAMDEAAKLRSASFLYRYEDRLLYQVVQDGLILSKPRAGPAGAQPD